MRRAEIRRWLRFSDKSLVARQLDELVTRCCRGDADARVMQMAFVDFSLVEKEWPDELSLEDLVLKAEQQQLKSAIFMLTDPPSHRMGDEGQRRQSGMGNHTPLGTRKWKARGHDRTTLLRLTADPHPDVVAIICRNPKVREEDIVTIASRRPNWTDVLDQIARSSWIQREIIRMSLIQNPFTNTLLAVGLLPQMGPKFLTRFRYASDVHPHLIDAVNHFLSLWKPGQ